MNIKKIYIIKYYLMICLYNNLGNTNIFIPKRKRK